MKKSTKGLLIPIAAFAVTVTGASAFNSSVLENAGLDTGQIAAFEQAHELRESGDKDAARDILMNAGVDMDTMHGVRDALKEHRAQMHEAVEEALESGDYDAFLEAVQDSPMEGKVDSPEEFDLFMEAHELRESGDKEGAREIMEDLGLVGKMMKGKDHGRHKGNNDAHGMRGMMGGHDGDKDEKGGRGGMVR